MVKAVQTDYRQAPLSPVDRALCDFAIQLTSNAASITPAALEALRQQGLSDGAISDAVQVIAYFNYINRVADGLGVDLEPGMPPPRPRPGDP